jgi:hypothetical protein
MSRMEYFDRQKARCAKDRADPPRPLRPSEANVSNRPDGDAETDALVPEPTRAELLELITGELRKSFAAALEAGASREELRRLLDQRRRALEVRQSDPDG